MSMYDSSQFFKTYFANASEKALLIDLMRDRFNPPPNALSILDLGCHDGALIKKILHTSAHKLPPKVSLTGVDPSPNAILEYGQNQFSMPIQKNTVVGTAEYYFLIQPRHLYFDWVLASQCLYWSENLPLIVKNIAECADAGLIILRGNKGVYEIQSQFKAYIGNPKEQFYTASDVESALLTQNIPFEKQVKTTILHLPSQGSIEMKWLIAFFLQWSDQDMDQSKIQEVESWILAKSSVQLPHEVCYFWLGNAISPH